MRRALRILSVAFITAGVVVLADVVLTLVWKEPVSAVYAAIQQGDAADELEAVQEDFLSLPAAQGADAGEPAAARARRLAGVFARELEEGEAIGRIRIPSIGTADVVIEGTDTAELQRGPGRFPDTSLPGQGRTIAVAGHRTTYGAPFNEIDAIENGDEIVLEMPYGVFTYEMSGSRIVKPDQTEVVDNVGRERLVLTACHPLYSAAKRYIVFADLAAIESQAPLDTES